MSNLLEQASLVMIPSGYKEDVVYSEIPINGAGDLAFTRASNGTRINSQGLVEVVPWNLFQQSENFPNAIWTKSTLTFNSTVTAPNGTSTAQNYSTAGAYSYVLQTITVSSGEYYTVSCYLKYTSGVGSISIGYTDAPSNNFIRVDANLINGTIGSVSYGGNGANGTATITSVGDGWYRVTVSGTLTIGNAGLIVSNLALGATTFSIWGAQLNIGSTAKPYFPTTDRLNVPRLTYQNGGGGCPSLLLEKQSTNLCLYSEQFDNAAWTKTDGTVTANQAISPDGTQNADKCVGNNGVVTMDMRTASAFSITSGSVYTWSLYVKKAGYRYCQMTAWTADDPITIYDLDNGVVVSELGPSHTSTITSFGNGWYRITITRTASDSIGWLRFSPLANSTASSAQNGTDGFYIWGAQVEASSYVTSYIVSTSSSATRVADAIGNQTTSIAQAFTDNTKGTIFFDLKNIKFQGGAEARFRFGNTADALQFAFFMDSVGLGVYGYQGGGYAVNVSTATNQKIAIRFDGTSLTGFSQGVKRNTVTAGTNYVIEQMVGNDTGNLCLEINEFVLFNSVLTDAECIALTTL